MLFKTCVGEDISVSSMETVDERKIVELNSGLIFVDSLENFKKIKKLNIPTVAHSSDDKENMEMLKLGANASLNKSSILDPSFTHFVKNCFTCFCK